MNERLIECFEDTLRLCESTELKTKTENAKSSSKVYLEGFIAKPDRKETNTDITLENTTTFAAAGHYKSYGRVAVLNFANPEVPGGGVKKGAAAQEECLCRCSNLYPCISSSAVYDDFYGYHYKHGRFFYSDRVIYTKDITVFKDDNLNLLDREQWFNVDVLTCSAPFIAKRKYTNKAALFELFKSRVKNIINVAIDNNADVLILGAFGCGAFKNPPELVAKAFKTVISENHYDEFFRKIVFAIKSSNNDDPFEPCPNLMAFEFEFDGISAEANKLRFSDSYSLEQAFGTVTLPSGRVLTGGKEFNPYFEWQKSNEFHGKQFSILGDSISTLEGYNPQGYNLFFTGEICQKSGVSDMNDTWWGQVISFCGGELLVNNSWSGSRVTKLPNRDSLFPSGCSDERTNGLHIGNIKPDVIIVYLGTNDWARGVEAASADGRDCDKMWASVFETAYSKMLEKLKVNYPYAEIFCCTLCTTYMSGKQSFVFPENYGGINIEKYNAVIRNAAESKNCNVIDLYKYHLPYDSIDGSHPNRGGMHTLAALMLREMLDETGAAFLDCDRGEHAFMVIDEFTGGTKYVCKKCGKTKTVSTLPEEKGQMSDSKTNESEYVMMDSNNTTMLYGGKLSVSTANGDLEFQKDIVEVGRDDDCDIVIPENEISRRHAAFYYENDRWFLRDNFSTNGTWLNNARIEPGKKYELTPNDEINFAMTEKVIFCKCKNAFECEGTKIKAISEQNTDKSVKAVAFLEAALTAFAKSQGKNEAAFKLIVAALTDAPLYFPVEIDVEAMLGTLDPTKLKPGDIIKNKKDVKMKIRTVTLNDETELISMFTSNEEAEKGGSTSLIRYYPQDYLPIIAKIGKQAIINPFSENRFLMTGDFITEILTPIVGNKKQSSVPISHPVEESLIGKTVGGKYTVLKLLGTGGYCAVYLVMDKRLNKMWAMKTFNKKNHSANLYMRDIILTEAQMMLGLNHPAIPMIVDIIEDDDSLFILREYIEGKTLESLAAQQGAQSADKVIEWGKQLCDALGYLHSRNLIYRDMKPDNVILRPNGTLKIVDFGIMRTYKPKQAEDTCFLGTKGYAAPEQFGGSQTDARTDVFGLGMTMFRLVTGINPTQPPYEIKPIRMLNPNLPEGLEYIISKCIMPNPKDRYRSCNELMAALNNYLILPRRKGLSGKIFGKK